MRILVFEDTFPYDSLQALGSYLAESSLDDIDVLALAEEHYATSHIHYSFLAVNESGSTSI